MFGSYSTDSVSTVSVATDTGLLSYSDKCGQTILFYLLYFLRTDQYDYGINCIQVALMDVSRESKQHIFHIFLEEHSWNETWKIIARSDSTSDHI